MSVRWQAIEYLVAQVPAQRTNIETGGNPSITAFQALRAIEAALAKPTPTTPEARESEG